MQQHARLRAAGGRLAILAAAIACANLAGTHDHGFIVGKRPPEGNQAGRLDHRLPGLRRRARHWRKARESVARRTAARDQARPRPVTFSATYKHVVTSIGFIAGVAAPAGRRFPARLPRAGQAQPVPAYHRASSGRLSRAADGIPVARLGRPAALHPSRRRRDRAQNRRSRRAGSR